MSRRGRKDRLGTRKRRGSRYPFNRDSVTYTREDSGCKIASTYLGRQSECFECPFIKCIYEMTYFQRNGLQRYIHGERISTKMIAGRPVGRPRSKVSIELIEACLKISPDIKQAAIKAGCSRPYIYKYLSHARIYSLLGKEVS